MFGLWRSRNSSDLLSSRLLSQDDFYKVIEKDLAWARNEVIIESPFLSYKRVNYLLPIFRKLARRNVRVIINTKPPEEQDIDYQWQAEECIIALQRLGIEVLITGGHHRKLAIIDRQILYEGSLNILSQSESCEIMRRIDSKSLATQMINFIGISKFIR